MDKSSAESFKTYLRDKLIVSKDEADTFVQEHNGKYYPPNYDVKNCAQYWKKADFVMNRNIIQNMIAGLQKIWQNTYAMEIGEVKMLADNRIDFDYQIGCYDPKLFDTNGWCFIAGEIKNKRWGFCDTSCKVMKHRNDYSKLYPEAYHENQDLMNSFFAFKPN